MNSSDISVVVPFFKHYDLLEHIVAVLTRQSCSPREIIIVDDASPGEMPASILEQPVSYIRREKNGGVAASRNTGWQAAAGEVVVFLDSDAVPEPFLIESFVNAYRALDASTAGVGGRAVESRVQSVYDRWRARYAKQEYGLTSRMGVPFLYGVVCSYRRTVLQEVGGFDPFFHENAGEDYDIGVRIRKKGYQLAYAPDCVVNHQHKDTLNSLLKAQYRWTYWGYMVNQRNGISTALPWGGLIRKILKETFLDLLVYRDLKLYTIGMQVMKTKFSALVQASRDRRAPNKRLE